MTTKKLIVIEQTDPRRPEVRELVAELDAYMQRLYPAESNHLLDVESLAQPEVLFFVGRVDGESLACGAIVLRGAEEGRHESGEAYAEVKRIYVSPRARGLGLGKKLLSHLEDAARAHRSTSSAWRPASTSPKPSASSPTTASPAAAISATTRTDDPLSLFMDKRL